MDNKPLEFWVAIVVAVVVKLSTSARLGFWGRLASTVVAIGSAYAFSHPIAEWLGLNLILIAALVTLSSEAVMRTVLHMVHDPEQLKELFRIWRGGPRA